MKSRLFALPFKGLLAIFSLLLCTGCQPFAPVQTKLCAVRDAGYGSVEFTAYVLNGRNKQIDHLFILASARGSNLFEYRLNGPFTPHGWTLSRSIKDASDDFNFSFASHLGPMDLCYIHLVYYADGSVWNIGTPI